MCKGCERYITEARDSTIIPYLKQMMLIDYSEPYRSLGWTFQKQTLVCFFVTLPYFYTYKSFWVMLSLMRGWSFDAATSCVLLYGTLKTTHDCRMLASRSITRNNNKTWHWRVSHRARLRRKDPFIRGRLCRGRRSVTHVWPGGAFVSRPYLAIVECVSVAMSETCALLFGAEIFFRANKRPAGWSYAS